MFVKLPRVVIGSDICGMILAAKYNATFIPISYTEPWAWEYIDYKFDFIQNVRDFLFQWDENHFESEKNKADYFVFREKDKIHTPNTYLWELEQYFKAVLGLNNNIWPDFELKDCYHNNNQLRFNGKYDCLVVEFKKLWVINPYSGIFESETLTKKNTNKSQQSHLLYYTKLDTEVSSDMKGIQTSLDIEEVENKFFTKIWYNKPFGMKQLQFGINPKTRGRTITTKHFVCISECVSNDEVYSEKYEVGNVRQEIHKFFAPKYKRIREKRYIFDKFVRKYVLGSEIDEYEDTEEIKFIHFSEKSEILCNEYLNIHSWQDSFLPFLFNNTDLSIRLALTNSAPKKQPL